MIQRTKDYSIFKFLEYNRAINACNLENIMHAISINNLLHSQPIIVNEAYEVIDGQHRLLAASKLEVEIFYIVVPGITKDSMVSLNSNKSSWKADDYFRYWLNQGAIEYIKLNDFMRKHKLTLATGIAICDMWRSVKATKRFRDGEFVFNMNLTDEIIEMVREVVAMIKERKKESQYVASAMFFKSLTLFLSTDSMNFDKFKERIQKQIPYIGPQSSLQSYVTMWTDIYNYKKRIKIITQ